jgi:flagellar M-ring protein FliF
MDRVGQLADLWARLDMQKRLIVAASALGVFLLVLLIARSAATPTMALLYSGLEASVAGEVVAALEQRGVAHSVQGDAIYVDKAERDRIRVTLAEEGLPSNGMAGYELLDNLSGFGTTAQMFDAAYWRAKEGELARTILAWPSIASARVHLAVPSARTFGPAEPPSASVTVRLKAGSLSDSRTRALRFLVASAVPGLAPDGVTVIDSDRGLVTLADGAFEAEGRDTDQADSLRRRIERLLSARVGAGNAVVEVTLETGRDRETIVERRFDPEGRVAISTDTEERSDSSSDSGAGAVTVASNLPDGDAAADGSATSASTETRERVNYEISETTRELVRQPGRIARITVAVLVNGQTAPDASGRVTFSPRPDEELAGLRELVESAIGFDADRGDVVTIKSMAFPEVPEAGTLAEASILDSLVANGGALARLALLGALALGLGLFVIRPILTAPPPAIALPAPGGDTIDGAATTVIGALAGPGSVAPEDPVDPVQELRRLIADRQKETVAVLRHWIESTGEETG